MKSKRSLSMDSQKKETLSGRGSGLESEYHSTPDTVCDVSTLSVLIRKKNVRVVDVRKEEEYATASSKNLGKREPRALH